MQHSFLLLCTLPALLAGCATAYKPDGFSGGYNETQLSENIWRVGFNGNGYTSTDKAIDFAMLRGAELCQSHGYPYFLISGSADTSKLSSYTQPATAYTTGRIQSFGNTSYGHATTTIHGGETETIYKPGVSNIVIGLTNRPEGSFAYTTAITIQSIKEKYGLIQGGGLWK